MLAVRMCYCPDIGQSHISMPVKNPCLLQNQAQKLTRSMFPDAESDSQPLERCMRILPHHSDTGGFFIAVFKKVAKYPKQEKAAK